MYVLCVLPFFLVTFTPKGFRQLKHNFRVLAQTSIYVGRGNLVSEILHHYMNESVPPCRNYT